MPPPVSELALQRAQLALQLSRLGDLRPSGGSRAEKKVVIGDGANSILALRCSHLNGRCEDYWEGPQAA